MDYLNSLNEQQKKAVIATEGPVLIVAGAGAGKTKTITHRILHLINNGILGSNILAITFTNKAAKEMRDRVLNLIPSQDDKRNIPFVSTFHALGVKIIKENAPLLKIPKYFTIYDTSDSKKAIKEALKYVGVEPKEHLDKVHSIISSEKSRGTNFSSFEERASYDYTSELTKKVWKRYEEIMRKDTALDFDDLLLKSLELLQKHKDVLERYQNKFLYIHVDEYQDTNKIQNEIVELLARKNKNICVVGDTDQNIYSWRGADIKNMLHFEKTYPEAQTIFLEENYRSTQTILDVANLIIEKNNYRIPKKLFTKNQVGEKITLFEATNEMDEALFIANNAKKLIDDGVPSEEIAVLYRANFQSRVLEEAFLSYGVPYQMLGTKFFERKEIKDCIAYITSSLNPESQSILRIINVPPRGIGKVTIDKIAAGKEDEIPAVTKLKIDHFKNILSDFKDVLLSENLSVALKYIIKNSGIEGMYDPKNEEDMERLENIMELVTLATEYDEYSGEEAIEKFLTDSALASDQDTLNQQKNGVKLMTVHSAKGLEFDFVFISGLEDGLFPHAGLRNTRKTKEDDEEERRLFYVALTRARKKLFLTYAQTRTIFGNIEVNAQSEFIDDISQKYIEKESFSGKKPLFSIEF